MLTQQTNPGVRAGDLASGEDGWAEAATERRGEAVNARKNFRGLSCVASLGGAVLEWATHREGGLVNLHPTSYWPVKNLLDLRVWGSASPGH